MEQQNTLDIVDPKYQRTLVYGIICMITGEMYVGCTIQTLNARIANHIRDRSCRAIQILDRGNYIPYVIQKWPCNTKREKLTLEGEWQRAYKACFPQHFVNRQIEGLFLKENPELNKACKRQYHQDHKEVRNAINKQYYEEHKEVRVAYQRRYYEDNKEVVKASAKKYRDEHKAEMSAYGKQYRKRPWTCEYCNKTMTTGGKNQHQKICKLRPVVHEAEKGC